MDRRALLRMFVLAGMLVTAHAKVLLAVDKPATGMPLSVLVVPEAIHNRDGMGTTTAISVVDRAAIAELVACFPKYDSKPTNTVAGAWEAGWQIYFNFSQGRTVRVIVSANDNGQTWSTGQGDFATRGNFKSLLAKLSQTAAKTTK